MSSLPFILVFFCVLFALGCCVGSLLDHSKRGQELFRLDAAGLWYFQRQSSMAKIPGR